MLIKNMAILLKEQVVLASPRGESANAVVL